MSELITSKEDLISYLTTKKIASSEPPRNVMVTSILRRKVLTDERQGRFIHKGRWSRFEFKSIGGGVYEASISEG